MLHELDGTARKGFVLLVKNAPGQWDTPEGDLIQ